MEGTGSANGAGGSATNGVADNKPVSSIKTCVNLINALSAIGILSIPYALSSGGWLGLVILLVISASAHFTGVLITRCMESNPLITTYSEIAGFAFGRKGRIIATIPTCLELYFVSTGFLIIEGENLHKLAPDFFLKIGHLKIDGRHSFVIITGAIIFPTMCLSNLGIWSYISLGGVLSSFIAIICGLCVGTLKSVGFDAKGSLVNFGGLPAALGLYLFCYGAHAIFPTIYCSMEKKNQFSKVLLVSFIVCTTTYVCMGILGYLIYGHDVQSQVTLNLPKGEISSKIAIYTILAVPIAKYGLTIMPVANSIRSCLPKAYRDNRAIGIVIKMLLLVSTMILAMVFPHFESVTSLTSAILIVTVSFLLPCACYLKIFQAYNNLGFELVGIVGVMILSVLAGAVGTYSSILHAVKQAH